MKISFGSNRSSCRGFTLIELLVVLVIFGFLAGGAMMVINVQDEGQRFNKQVERFVAYAVFAQELSAISGDSVALFVTPPEWREDGEFFDDDELRNTSLEGDTDAQPGWQYEFKQATATGWRLIEEMPRQDFDEQIDLIIEVNGDEWDYDEDLEIQVPIVEFAPSGDITPFTIELSHEDVLDDLAHVELGEFGDIIWREAYEYQEQVREYREENDAF